MKARLWKKILGFTVSILVIGVLVCSYFFWNSWKINPEARIIEIGITPKEVGIGDLVQIEIVTELPWYRRPKEEISLDVPDGLQILDNTKQNLIGVSLGKWTWRSVIEVQAYDFGPFQNLTATVSMTPDKNNKQETIAGSIPEIVVNSTLGTEASNLEMASELSEEFLRQQSSYTRKWLFISLGVIACLVVLAYFLFRRRPEKKTEAPKPWTVAESLIFGLEDRLPLDAETVFVGLTDIIRRYIESVYSLPATERTTPEFLTEMKRDSSQLSADHGLLLADFLTAADMVKFARLEATQSQIEEAIKKAKRFIVETSEPIIKGQTLENNSGN